MENNTNTQTPIYVKRVQIARALGLSEKTVSNYMESGYLPSVERPNGRRAVLLSDYEAWVGQRELEQAEEISDAELKDRTKAVQAAAARTAASLGGDCQAALKAAKSSFDLAASTLIKAASRQMSETDGPTLREQLRKADAYAAGLLQDCVDWSDTCARLELRISELEARGGK